jgi:hypothetical protein
MHVGHSLVQYIVIVITNQDSTSSRLLPGSSCSCCIRSLHALVHKQCHPVHITTAHEILQRRKWQLCKSTLPPNHSGSWTRKEKMGFVIHGKVVHSQSCASLAATRKPIYAMLAEYKTHRQCSYLQWMYTNKFVGGQMLGGWAQALGQTPRSV